MHPMCAGSRSVATATSAMSSASTKGSPTVLSTMLRDPAAISSAQNDSLKFWKKKAERRIVQSAPDSMNAASERRAPSSPRPERSTRRVQPRFTARRAKAAKIVSAPGIARSGWKQR